ncbi:hypothetical protein MJO29_012247 [Puccinia striiformis f. sp. tritici]|nr:hypothetical protein MJO29_012247 [Puccinia striiformis f. sp. tritici]
MWPLGLSSQLALERSWSNFSFVPFLNLNPIRFILKNLQP